MVGCFVGCCSPTDCQNEKMDGRGLPVWQRRVWFTMSIMLRRWIIRTIFVGLLSIFIGGWIASTFYFYSAAFGNDRHWIGLNQGPGTIIVGGVWIKDPAFHTPNSGLLGWRLWEPKFWPEFWPSKLPGTTQYFLGFSFQYDSVPGGYQRLHVAVPFWFLTLLSGGGVWVVWRKTRRGEFRGFPVEVS